MNITKTENKIINSLTLSCIKHNYPEFVREFGYEDADKRMESLFGTAWNDCKELVWQWHDYTTGQVRDMQLTEDVVCINERYV